MSSVKPGQPVRITVDAYPGRVFDGQVRFVSPALRADQRALTVEAVVPNADGLLRPGIFVSAVLEGAVREQALFVPRAALRTEAGISRVFVVRGDRVEERMVTAGQASGELVEIRDGVSGGERVAVSGLSGLADGARVRVAAGPGSLAVNGGSRRCSGSPHSASRRPVFATVLILLADRRRRVRLHAARRRPFPKVDFPTIVVTTRSPGAAPEEIETEITDKIEEAVNTISGIDELRSTSAEGVSQVIVAFLLEKDVDVAAQEVRDRVNRVLPLLPRTDPAADRREARSRRGAGAHAGGVGAASRSATSPSSPTRCCGGSSRASTASARCWSSAAARGRSTSGSTPRGCAPTTSR